MTRSYSTRFKVICTIIRLYKDYKPLAFFGLLSGLLFIIATVFFLPVFVEYLYTRIVLQFPTLIVCGFTVLTAIMSLFVGVMLSSMRQKNKQDFEYLLLSIQDRYSKDVLK